MMWCHGDDKAYDCDGYSGGIGYETGIVVYELICGAEDNYYYDCGPTSFYMVIDELSPCLDGWVCLM